MSRVLLIDSQSPISREIGEHLAADGLDIEYAAGHIDALHRLRCRAFGLIVTSAEGVIEEALALLEEMRLIRPSLNCIVSPLHTQRHHRGPACACLRMLHPPFNADEIAGVVRDAALSEDSTMRSRRHARAGLSCASARIATAERLMSFAREFAAQLPETARQDIMFALREILMNAMEYGAKLTRSGRDEVSVDCSARSMTFRVRDPARRFRKEDITHAAHAKPSTDPGSGFFWPAA